MRHRCRLTIPPFISFLIVFSLSSPAKHLSLVNRIAFFNHSQVPILQYHHGHLEDDLVSPILPCNQFSTCSFPRLLNSRQYRKTFTLNTGDKIPAIGLGTWQSKPNEVRDAVKLALKKGYRHIDTALAYGNEHEVGQGIKDSGVPREEIWLTTKLDNTWHHIVPEGIESSLKSLGTDYVDLYLMVSLGIWAMQTLAE